MDSVRVNSTPTPHSIETGEVVAALRTDSNRGLSRNEAASRLSYYGPNQLPEAGGPSPLSILLAQFRNLLVIILLAAATLSFVIWVFQKETTFPYDTIVIMAIVIANAGLGFYQEYRAEQSLEKLVALSGPEAIVIRDGARLRVQASELVPGDITVIATGDRISADARLLSAAALEINESPLTGESEPVLKSSQAVQASAPVADRICMVFSGTAVTSGHGIAAVTRTGTDTEIGKIAELIRQAPPRDTPLQQNLDKLGKRLAMVILAIAAVVAVTGFLFTGDISFDNAVEMLLFGVALAVAAIPEGLPAVVTGALALGTQRMVRENAIIRRLPAVETLGSTTAICSDKTGTLTVGEMTVREVQVHAGTVIVGGAGYAPEGGFEGPENAVAAVRKLARSAVLCNDADIVSEEGRWQALGSPTEAAMVTLAAKMGIDYQELREKSPRIAESQFSPDKKWMSVAVTVNSEIIIHSKGAPERIIPLCTHVLTSRGLKRLDARGRDELLESAASMASRALRTLAVATQKAGGIPPDGLDELQHDLILLGLVGIADPPRPEARASVEECHRAGIEVLMVTGDHLVTAQVIAAELGIVGEAVTGADIDGADDEELREIVKNARIFARVSPKHKVKIVSILQEQGHSVAVTGDGVNDAPALKHADIGIAMGVTGTDVSREAADMVLADDNFATIVAAVEEGRSIFSNIRRFVAFLLATNSGEVLTLFAGVLMAAWLGLQSDGKLLLPLLAVQILWINLVTDGLPALALGVESKHAGAMLRPPRPRSEQVINKVVWQQIGVVGLVSAAGTLLVLDAYLDGGLVTLFDNHDITYARTMAFVTLALFQMYDAFNCRFLEHSSLPRLWGNKWLFGAVAISVAMMITVVQIPALESAFHTAPLALSDWLIAAAVGSLALWSVELLKIYNNLRNGKKPAGR